MIKMKEKSQNQKVYELFLKGGEYTAESIYEETGVPIDNIFIYLNTLKNKNKIKIVDKIGRFNIYTIIPREEREQPIQQNSKEAIEYLEFLNNLTIQQNSKEAIEYLEFLNNFFKENYKLLSSKKSNIEYIIQNENKFNKIEEMIKNVKST
jgi:sugar-specific transcriptional regulator TrmB